MSIQPRKQRKARYTAPAHARGKYLSASVSKDLREKVGKKSLPLKTGDKARGRLERNESRKEKRS